MKIYKIFFCLIIFLFLGIYGCGSGSGSGNSSNAVITVPTNQVSRIGSYSQQGVKIGNYYEKLPEYNLEGIKKPWQEFYHISYDFEGHSTDIEHVLRGYENIIEKLNSDTNK